MKKATKKAARKVVPKRRKLAQKPRPALDQFPEWQKVFDIPKPPAGFAYQWAPVTAVFRMELHGWSRVPFSRHPEMGKERNFDGYIVYCDQTLFQIAAELHEMKLGSFRKAAEAQHQACGNEAIEALSRYSWSPHGGYRGQMHILSPAFMVSSDYPRAEPGDATVDISIRFRMPYSWADAAGALGLTKSEYVRRRLLMVQNFLAPQSDGTYAAVELTTEKVED
jgi:hypothetical protein